MTDDDKALVERLRKTYRKEYAPTGSTVGNISNRLRPFPILATEVLFNPDGREAADRIEALSAENERLERLERALESFQSLAKEQAEELIRYRAKYMVGTSAALGEQQ